MGGGGEDSGALNIGTSLGICRVQGLGMGGFRIQGD